MRGRLKRLGRGQPDLESRLHAVCGRHVLKHHKLGQPRYELIETTGLQHEQEFRVRARLTADTGEEGNGRTKRAAEKSAAAKLLIRLEKKLEKKAEKKPEKKSEKKVRR